MAIVTAFRFTEKSGAICIDQESWHIWRRKTWFSDNIHLLVPEDLADQFGIELVYAGTGHPPFHCDTAELAGQYIHQYVRHEHNPEETITVEMLGRIVLRAFQEVHSRRVNNKLQFLFGFTCDDFSRGEFQQSDQTFHINQEAVKERALQIINGKENTGYNPLSPPVEACLIGVDPKYGYSAFAIKENDGVLSFQSCWFESLGQGRDGAVIRFAKDLNDRFLDTRRKGKGLEKGLITLIEATSVSMEHYGQNGGSIRIVLVDAAGKRRQDRIKDIKDNSARLSLEVVRAFRSGYLTEDVAADLLKRLIANNESFETVEKDMFRNASQPVMLGKLLRGYKICEGDLAGSKIEEHLFCQVEQTARGGRK
ncbi:hypothetical protein JW979_16300 [bacterium]|nr:hypothetical protein [candidate division CSSED10-310 bacterium]